MLNQAPPCPTPLIRMENIHKSFGALSVLKGIDAQVNRGQVISLLGPSGSGKSTLLRCLNQLVVPDQGQIYFHGEKTLAKGYDLMLLRQKMGMVFQNFHLFPHMTALENIAYAPVAVGKMNRHEASEKARGLLGTMDLSDKADVYPRDLSGGQKQRVAIARCLAMEPEVILFDEPTSALDPEMVKEVLDVLRGLARSHITLLVVTHEMAFARDVSHVIWFMDQGRIVEMASPQSFFNDPQHPRSKVFLEKVL